MSFSFQKYRIASSSEVTFSFGETGLNIFSSNTIVIKNKISSRFGTSSHPRYHPFSCHSSRRFVGFDHSKALVTVADPSCLLSHVGVQRETPEGFLVLVCHPASTNPGSLQEAQNLLVSIIVL
jgi:hypothetical protein